MSGFSVPSPRPTILLLTLLALAPTAGCSDDDGPTGNTGLNPLSASVSIPSGTGVPGCENDDSCFAPFSARIRAGGTVTFTNDDSAAHTITSGDPSNGPDGTFDSSLLMAGKTFETTLTEVGSQPYFCMVHPWQTGVIEVE